MEEAMFVNSQMASALLLPMKNSQKEQSRTTMQCCYSALCGQKTKKKYV